MSFTSSSFKIVRWRDLISARILFPYVQTATAKPGASAKAGTTLQKIPGGTEVEGGRRATVSVTGRLLLLDVKNMKRK
jgi:hypothetical protein